MTKRKTTHKICIKVTDVRVLASAELRGAAERETMQNIQMIDQGKVDNKKTETEPGSQPRKWIPLVVLCFVVPCLIIAFVLTGLYFKRSTPGFDPSCHNATAERVLEATNLQLTEERDRLKQQLQHMNQSSSGGDLTCHNETAERLLEATNLQLTEERDRLKQALENMGWRYFGGSWYLGSTTEQTWNESRQFCQERGGDLVIVNSTEEKEFLRVTFPDRTWIGLSELLQEGVWKWVDGSLLTTSFWGTGEPNDYSKTDEDCVETFISSSYSFWNDLRCDEKLKCICEIRIIF